MRQSVSLTMLTDEPPYLSVGTEVSAKYKGAFCEAKVRKVDKTVKCKVSFKLGCGTYTVLDSSIKGTLRVGASVEAKHPEKKEFFEATITKIQDCSQYTVVFDDGDITTLRRSALCLKSGRHFAESETLDQLPLTHPEHFSNPVVGAGGRRGRRRLLDDSSGDEENTRKGKAKEEKEADIGKVVCVELGDKKKVKDNWFPGLVVSPNAQDTVQIRVKDEYLIRSFSDGRYYTVPKKEASEFTREIGIKVDNNTLKTAVEKALRFIDKDELPPHWDRELLFGLVDSDINSDSDEGLDSESSDDEPREEKDHFVAQLYKFMDDRGTPINNCPSIGGKDLDLYKLFNVVHKLNGYNRVTNRNQWKIVSTKLGLGITASIITQVKHAYKKYLHSFEDFYRKLGCTMVSHPRSNRARNKSGRSLIRDRDRTTPSNLKAKVDGSPFENTKSNSKSDENAEKDGGSEGKSKEEGTEKKEDKSKGKDEEVEKNAKSKNSKKDIEVEEVSESEESVSVSEEAYSMSRPTSSLRKKFPTLKASPVVVRDKRKAESSPDGRKCKRTRLLKSRSSSGSDVKTTSDNEDDSKGKEFSYQRNTTRSRSKEDVKTKKESEKEKKLKSAGNNNSENQKKMLAVKAKRNENEEPQKKGRKRRNTDTGGKSPNPAEEDLNLPCLPSYKSVFTGDVLKIYYGAPGEPKVIYEAKVVDIKENESGETLYLVHYAGWNSRYDEWVKRNKIADNLNWTPARGKVVPVAKQNSKSCATQKRKPSSGKNEQSGGGPGTRSTTPLSVTSTSSRNKSPATSVPPGGKRVTRNMGDVKPPKRTRRVSGHTELSVDSESESDVGESVSDTEGNKKAAPSTGKEETIPKTACPKKLVKKPAAKKKVVKKAVEEKTGGSNEEETGKNKRTKKGGVVVKEKETEEKKSVVEEKSESGKEADEPKGRDFDLNEIRSELKGIDKAVKMNSELTLIESSEESGKAATEEKGVVTVEEPVEAPPEPSKDEKMMVKPEEKSPEKKEVKDDIYEFKEPEPFEYQEVLRPINRMFEEGDRSPDKTVKKPILLTEKKEVCKFEVDVKSRFRKTIGKKMKEVTSAEVKNESPSKSERPEVLPKVEGFSTSEFHAKPSEKEIPVLKVEVEVRKSKSPDPVRLFPPVQEEQQQPEKKVEVTPEKEQMSKPQLEVETCKSPQTSKLSPEPPSLTPVTNNVFGNNRPPTSPLLTLINEESKKNELKKGENGPEEEDDPISAAIQRVIAQSSMDDDSDDMDLFAVSSSNVTAAPVTATVTTAVAVTTTAIATTAASVAVTITATTTASTTTPAAVPPAPPTALTAPEEVPELPKPSQLTANETEVLVRKKVCSKRKSTGKRLMLSKEFVMDDSSTDSDSDSAEERLVIVNEDESANDDSNRTQKNPVVSGGTADEERDKKLLTGTATTTTTTTTTTTVTTTMSTTTSTSTPTLTPTPTPTPAPAPTSTSAEARFKKAEEAKSPPSSVEASQPKKIHPNDSSGNKKVGPPGKSEEEWKSQKQEKSAEQEEGENNLRSLLCEETIPGSPAPMTESKESSESKMNVLDMQFANSSQPVSLPPPAPSIGKAEGNEAVVVMDNTPPTTPESNLSSMSGSPRDDRVGSSSLDNESSKSLRDSSEIDVDNEHQRMKNLKYPKKPDKESSDSLAKKKWRNRKRSESLSDGNKRVRQPVGRPPKTKDLGSDSDDTSENSQTGGHNVNTESLMNSRSQKPSKYNFYCELDPELDATQRIALLEQKLQECRKTYMNVKSKLASLDRRRKKIRRREREEKASAAAAARSQDVACQ